MTIKTKIIAGVDEAGRGPLAGPVYAAAVILDRKKPIQGLNDSKKLSHKKRVMLAEEIKQYSLAYSIHKVEVPVIDKINILQASLLAMKNAIEALSLTPELALIDGNKAPQISLPCETIIGGDALEPCISAASILAKVARDNEMMELDTRYPEYGFAKHKGYGTKQHLEAIYEYGPCAIHRKSFQPIKTLISEISLQVDSLAKM